MGLPAPAAEELSQLGTHAWGSQEGCVPLLMSARPSPSALHCKEGLPSLSSTAELRHSITNSTLREGPDLVLSETDQCLLCAGIDAAKAKYTEVPKLSVHFAADASGLLQVTKGEAVIETTEEYTVKVRAGIAPHPNCCTSFALCCLRPSSRPPRSTLSRCALASRLSPTAAPHWHCAAGAAETPHIYW